MTGRLFVFFVNLALFLSACGSGQVVSEVTPTPFPTPLRPTFTMPLALETVYFQISGQVREVYANVNDKVTEGQLLGELAEAQELREQAITTQTE